MADWNTVRYDPSYIEPLDPEIIPLCDALNLAGFVTTSSCCGHGYRRPHVWFEHSSDERIEDMARFVLQVEIGDFRRYFSLFLKEICIDGYSWSLEIHLNNVYHDTPVADAMVEANHAIANIARSIHEWNSSGAGCG